MENPPEKISGDTSKEVAKSTDQGSKKTQSGNGGDSPTEQASQTTSLRIKEKKDCLMKSPDGKWVRTNTKLGFGSFKSVYLAIERGGGEVAWNVIKLGKMGPAQKKKVPYFNLSPTCSNSIICVSILIV